MPGYRLIASPTLYAGQVVSIGLSAAGANNRPVHCRVYVGLYDADDALVRRYGPAVLLSAGDWREVSWRIEDTGGAPIAEIGVELSAGGGASGCVYLDYLTWDGPPDVELGHPGGTGEMWRRAWVDAVDQLEINRREPYRLIQNRGTGLLIQGTREWRDYRVSADLTLHLVRAAGIGARVQGLRRYYALLLCEDGVLRLVKALHGTHELAAVPFPWEPDQTYRLTLQVVDAHLSAWVDGRLVLDVEDQDQPLDGGGVALLCEEGRVAVGPVQVQLAIL
jgi:hypothetical protein